MTASLHWRAGRHRFAFGPGPARVMGIVNVTPDSFSDGGQAWRPDAALAQCERLVADGADILDIGGESTRPGAAEVDAAEEWRRVAPVLRHALGLGVAVLVDTRKSAVMRAALELGADIVNDVQALQDPGALEAVAAHPHCGVVLMHMQGRPADMQQAPHYEQVTREVGAFLQQRVLAAQAAGIATERLALDPGYGFGKTADHNWCLLAQQAQLAALGRPLLVGLSRKSMLAAASPRPADQRLGASVAAALLAVQRGAHIVRVHDVAATVDALRVWQRLQAQDLDEAAAPPATPRPT